MLHGGQRARTEAPRADVGRRGLVAVAVAAWAVVAGSGVLGAYAVLAATNVSLAKVVVWSWWTVGALAVGLAAVPAIVCPAIIAGLRRQARQGSQLHAAFLVALLTMNAAIIVSVGIFASTRWGNGILHERYFFYLVPLWLIAIAVWCPDGLATTRRQLVIGVLLAFCLVATLPPGLWTAHATVWLQWPSSTAWALLGYSRRRRAGGLSRGCGRAGLGRLRRAAPRAAESFLAIVPIASSSRSGSRSRGRGGSPSPTSTGMRTEQTLRGHGSTRRLGGMTRYRRSSQAPGAVWSSTGSGRCSTRSSRTARSARRSTCGRHRRP